MIPSYLQLFSSSIYGEGIILGTGMFLGKGPLSLSTEIPWRRISAMSSEARFELFPEAEHLKSEISTPRTIWPTNKELL